MDDDFGVPERLIVSGAIGSAMMISYQYLLASTVFASRREFVLARHTANRLQLVRLGLGAARLEVEDLLYVLSREYVMAALHALAAAR